MKKKYPFVEELDGRVYINIAKSAPQVALLILWHRYPERMSKEELVLSVARHDFKRKTGPVPILVEKGMAYSPESY
jgi:hypothetical protein